MLDLALGRSAPFVMVLLAVFMTSGGVTAANAQITAPAAPHEINVTSDSPPGWIPSPDQERAARQAATAFLAALDGGKVREAYALLADKNRSAMPYATFSAGVSRFNAEAGAVVERRIVKTTWTKDPSDAPVPGVYAAIDLVSHFARIDRHCGYLILYQPPAGGPFRVMRRQDAYVTNASASSIETQQSKAQLDAAWRSASASCPNYVAESPQVDAPLPEQSNATGYPTVAAALADLRSRPGVAISIQQGWTIAEEKASRTVWSFAPSGHPAYPSAVKRQVVQTGDGATLRMSILCEAAKAPCDALVRSFADLNAQMTQSLQKGR
jgi:hypothetical protein